jgi:sporulation-control protein spo0M
MFGFGKGKIDIVVQKTNYAPGDTISGNVALTLKKPVNAREMSISLIGEQMITTREKASGLGITGGGIGWGSSSSSQVERVRVYDFKLPLDSEKEYSEGREYPFEIKIPADILSMRPQKTGTMKFLPVVWYLLAKLDIPRGLDIKKKVDITIG